MAKSKAEMIKEYVALGGKPEDVSTEMTVAEIEAKLDALKEAKDLEAKLAAAAAAEAAQAKEKQSGDTNTPASDQDAQNEPPAAAQDGVTLVLSRANTYSTARLPGKVYVARKPFTTADEKEIRVLLATGFFEEV